MLKKLLLSILVPSVFVVSLVACKKETEEPGTTSRTLTPTESKMVGRWNLDASYDTSWIYNAGLLVNTVTTTKNDFDNSYFIDFTQNGVDPNIAKNAPKALKMIYALNGSPSDNFWYAPDSRTLVTGGPRYTIVSIGATNLEISMSNEAITSGTGQKSNVRYVLSR